MDIHLDLRGEHLIERQLRSGRYHSPEQVVVSALEALNQSEQAPSQNDERRRAVQDMLAFAGEHRFTLGEDLNIRDLVHEGHKY
jgi:Arc/MetJ-type ribon-helix-helix transcriptional regulator